MKTVPFHKVLRGATIVSAFLFLQLWLYPVSSGLTRYAGVLALVFTWFGLVVLLWRNSVVRNILLGFTTLFGVFIAFPVARKNDVKSLRSDYVKGLQRYDGVLYYWGGESPLGIDCSGLIRRGLIDAFAIRGIRSGDARLVRYAIWLWWHDCTARDLGEERGLTSPILSATSINTLDHSELQPGDLAVTSSGLHILAYLGNERWIQADPGTNMVISLFAPSKDNAWFQNKINVVRWKSLL